ncbi:M67 family metallopeptidase [Photobacterium sp. 2_MG-2023]|uniref:M67 family metallopeptidase n=1 Tax=Photobacterium arenosum TaxID=2774143 RepID=A0ABR9BMC1_9GAMM|nr:MULTISPECIES: M67 family metallopeptidase [Photobacterium]MBD8513715.1 M67 family metallopeptidase [Photobacterium arenosum]MDO6582509.1 M67 family metallopeptidase [Photobacterium sp. 2_MG-2023]
MLVLTQSQIDAIVAHARQEHPLEACGLIVGPAGSDIPSAVIPMRNIAESEVYFRFDSKQQLQVWRQMEEEGSEPIVLYHSHSGSRAYPSREDLAFSLTPHTHHVIVSTSPDSYLEVRSFRYLEGRPVEENIKIIQ